MQTYLLLMLVLSPFLLATILSFTFSQSLVSLVLVLVGAIAGTILIVLSGIIWLQVLHRNWMESQAAGFIFVPVVLPFLAYTGAIAGVSLVAILTIYSRHHAASNLFWAVAIGLTVGLAGLMPSAIVALPWFSRTIDLSESGSHFLMAPISAIGIAVASSSVASLLAHSFLARFI